MKFKDMPYERVSYEEIEKRYNEITELIRNASSGEDMEKALLLRRRLNEDLTAMELCYVRHDMDLNDEFYAAEQDYYDITGPKIYALSSETDKLILNSPYRSQAEKTEGKFALTLMENGQKAFDGRLIELSQEENSLINRYNTVTANAEADWQGEKVKLNLMQPYICSEDRETRRKSALAVSDAWEGIRAEIEEIYDKLVINRNKQAETMGVKDYSELSLSIMNRIGYGKEEISDFRQAVKENLVPFHEALTEKRRKRLVLDKLEFYDNGFYFTEGNPKPVGDTEFCIEATRKMYRKLSPETGEFIDFMLDNGLFDAEVRKGKRGGGYMTFFEKYRSPFIFANFDGTSENAYIMCHEGGHAFQGYLKRNSHMRQYTSEAAETHAMAMEYFTMPYMELFFGDRARDYEIMQLEDGIRLIVSECQQDEFQQLVYENPQMSREERNGLWARLNGEYFPSRSFEGNDNLYRGCGWQRIPHMYCTPFYTVDYALAEVCALEYYKMSWENREKAWGSYLEFCGKTGEENFAELVRAAGLEDPFSGETLRKLAEWLSGHII